MNKEFELIEMETNYRIFCIDSLVITLNYVFRRNPVNVKQEKI